MVAIEARAARPLIPVEVVHDPSLDGHRFPDEIEAAAYFVVVEALANVLKHADATSARVELSGEDGRLRLSVTDDGAGFDPATPSGSASRASPIASRPSGERFACQAPSVLACLVAELPVGVLVRAQA